MGFERVKRRESTRLRGYDYSRPGLYYVTLCTWNRQQAFGEIKNGKMDLSHAGKVATETWQGLPDRFGQVRLDSSLIMPDHFHGIIELLSDKGAASSAPTETTAAMESYVGAGLALPALPNKPENARSIALGDIIRTYKSISAIAINRTNGPLHRFRWQRGYFDRIVRNERELKGIREYIRLNPKHWQGDDEFLIALLEHVGLDKTYLDWRNNTSKR